MRRTLHRGRRRCRPRGTIPQPPLDPINRVPRDPLPRLSHRPHRMLRPAPIAPDDPPIAHEGPAAMCLLGYWKLRGMGQLIRLLLSYTGTPFQEKQYE